jgi:magnesium-transporting ATPase (P-type)
LSETKGTEWLVRHYPKSIVLALIVVFLLSIFLPYLNFIQSNASFTNPVEPTTVNGILTATAIVFSFLAFELREVKASILERFLLSLPLLLFLMVTVEFYFLGVINGKVNMSTFLVATSNFLFNILYACVLFVAKGIHEELEKQHQKKVNMHEPIKTKG